MGRAFCSFTFLTCLCRDFCVGITLKSVFTLSSVSSEFSHPLTTYLYQLCEAFAKMVLQDLLRGVTVTTPLVCVTVTTPLVCVIVTNP